MKDEIKEILSFKENADYKKLSIDEIVILENYITNLQEKLEVSQTNEETYRLEMEDITKILGLDEYAIFDEVKEYATNLQEEVEYKELWRKEYLERIDKAIRYIHKNYYEVVYKTKGTMVNDLLNILNGDDE